MAERLMALVLKTSDAERHRGFESLSLRFFPSSALRPYLEKYPSGRRGSPAKGVVLLKAARVQIPASPPDSSDLYNPGYFYAHFRHFLGCFTDFYGSATKIFITLCSQEFLAVNNTVNNKKAPPERGLLLSYFHPLDHALDILPGTAIGGVVHQLTDFYLPDRSGNNSCSDTSECRVLRSIRCIRGSGSTVLKTKSSPNAANKHFFPDKVPTERSRAEACPGLRRSLFP